MAKRTYLPELIRLLKIICKYIVAHRATMVANAPVTTGVKLDAIMVACEAFLLVVGEDVPDDSPYPS